LASRIVAVVDVAAVDVAASVVVVVASSVGTPAAATLLKGRRLVDWA
jgi:hypothetical protein